MHKYIFVFFILLAAFKLHAKEPKDFETLISTEEVFITNSGLSKWITEEKFKVLTEKGRSILSIYKVRLSSSNEEFSLLEAYSVTNGQKQSVNKNNLLKSKLQDQKFGLSDGAEITVPVNNLAIGSEFFIRYQIIRKPLLDNIFSATMAVSNSTLAAKESYRFISDVPILSQADNMGDYFTLVHTGKDGKFLVEVAPTQKARDLEGIKTQAATYTLTTAKNWKTSQ